MLLKWKPEFATDNGIIDDDHKEIIGHINTVIAALVSGVTAGQIAPMIDALLETAARHFEREEHLQALLNFPDCASHREEHRLLLHHVARMGDALRGLSPDHPPENPAELKAMLYKWMLNHFMQSDLKMQSHLHATAA